MAAYHLTIKDWPEQERPREKLLEWGPQFLTDAELLAILIGSGTRDATALDIAKKMLVEQDGLAGVASQNAREMMRMNRGVGVARSTLLVSAFEIGRRMQRSDQARQKIKSAADVAVFYKPALGHLKYEVFKAMLLDNGNRIIKDVQITKGTLNASLVHPREVFKEAIDHLAAGVIVVHNHPSGNTTPSREDMEISAQLKQAGKVVGIPIIDHVILGEDGYYSFSDHGYF